MIEENCRARNKRNISATVSFLCIIFAFVAIHYNRDVIKIQKANDPSVICQSGAFSIINNTRKEDEQK